MTETTDRTTEQTSEQTALAGVQDQDSHAGAPEAAKPAQEAPEAGQEAPAPGEGPEVPGEDSEGEERGKGSNAEAAKYRRRLRETEAERDQLRTDVHELKRELVLKDYKIPEELQYMIRRDGTDEQFRQSLEDLSRLASRPGVVRESGTGPFGTRGADLTWSDALAPE